MELLSYSMMWYVLLGYEICNCILGIIIVMWKVDWEKVHEEILLTVR